MEQPVFKRVLLKISGEALAGDKHLSHIHISETTRPN